MEALTNLNKRPKHYKKKQLKQYFNINPKDAALNPQPMAPFKPKTLNSKAL